MADQRDTKEVRERVVDRLRSSGVDKATAAREADNSLRRVESRFERGDLSNNRGRKP